MSRLEEIKSKWKERDINVLSHMDWLINRVEELERKLHKIGEECGQWEGTYQDLKEKYKELEEENRKLNHEIGKYSADIHELSRNIVNECTELRLAAKKMLKGESE